MTGQISWREVPQAPGYFASNAGEIRDSKGVRKPYLDGDGYYRVGVYVDGRRRLIPVHTLVLQAWVGDRPTKEHSCAHGDGTRTNNQLSNLRWATALEQYQDRMVHGTDCPAGEKNWVAKLTDDQVVRIALEYRPRQKGKTHLALATKYGVSKFAIYWAIRVRHPVIAGKAAA